MTARLYLKRGGAASLSTEVMLAATGRKGSPAFEEQTPLVNLGMRYADGESSQGEVTLTDPLAEIPSSTYRLPPHGLVTLTEDASGDELWLARTRVGPLTSGRRAVSVPKNEIEWKVQTVDCNIDLTGNHFTEDWVRPAETDIVRIVALKDYILNGTSSTAPKHRKSTVIEAKTDGAGHLLNNDTTYDLPAHTYPAGTVARDVLQDIAERAGKLYGVVIHHEGGSHLCLLYIEELDHATYRSDVKISQVIADWDPDDLTEPVFEPIWDRGMGTQTDNDGVISGLVSIYGGTNDDPQVIFVDQSADDETPHEFWTDSFFDDQSESATEAENRANAILAARRAPGHRTHQLSIKMHPEQTGLITAGMSLQIKSAVVTPAPIAYVYRRITELRWELAPDGDWFARIDLDKPLRRAAIRGGNGQPAATNNPPFVEECDPTPGTELSNTEDDPTDWPGTVENTSACWSGEDYLRMGASGGHSDSFSVSAGTTVQASVRVRNSTGSASWTLTSSYKYRVWIRLTGSGMPNIDTYIVDQLYPGDPVTDCIDVTKTGSVAVPTGYTAAALHFHGRNGGWKYQASMSTAAVDDCPPGSVPTGSAGTSDNVPRYDDPRITSYNADDQHLITRLSQRVVNNSGGTLDVGDVVIPDTSYAGQGVTTTTTAALTAAMVGVVLEGADDDGDMVVVWQGVITTGVNDGAATSADGDYLYTSTTAGAASVSGSRTTGAVGRVVRDDSGDPDYVLWWGVPDAGSGSGVTYGTPAIVLGTAAAAGSIDEAIRRDSTIVAFDATAPSTQALGDSAATGSAAVAARRDHKHAMPSAATVTGALDFGESGDIAAEAFGSTVLAGATGEVADAGHRHAMPAAPIINTDGDPGKTIYVGFTDPVGSYTLFEGDVWIERDT